MSGQYFRRTQGCCRVHTANRLPSKPLLTSLPTPWLTESAAREGKTDLGVWNGERNGSHSSHSVEDSISRRLSRPNRYLLGREGRDRTARITCPWVIKSVLKIFLASLLSAFTRFRCEEEWRRLTRSVEDGEHVSIQYSTLGCAEWK